jgi:hypothetical protein
MKDYTTGKIDLKAVLQPESSLERAILQAPDFRRGLFWGVPRYGHPEGEIYKHIKEVLTNIDRLPVNARDRSRLRIIAFAHDTFKYCEDKRRPRDWSHHHGRLARHFLADYTGDSVILDIVELHDEAYYAWRTKFLYHLPENGEKRLQKLLDRLKDNLQLYYLFFKCDTLTGDKTPAPLHWFEKTVDGIKIVEI